MKFLHLLFIHCVVILQGQSQLHHQKYCLSVKTDDTTCIQRECGKAYYSQNEDFWRNFQAGLKIVWEKRGKTGLGFISFGRWGWWGSHTRAWVCRFADTKGRICGLLYQLAQKWSKGLWITSLVFFVLAFILTFLHLNQRLLSKWHHRNWRLFINTSRNSYESW